MKLYEAKDIITEVFEKPFDKETFSYFIRNLLKNLQSAEFLRTGYNIPKAFEDFIASYARLGKYEDKEGNLIDVLIIELKRNHSIDYARSTQRNFVRWYLNDKGKDAALVAFHTKKSSEWRFSFIKMQYSLENKADELTPAKRSSFMVGESGKSHTAQRQLIDLLKNDHAPCLSDIENAFSIEAVSDEFYEKYKILLFNLVDEIEKIVEKDKTVKEELESKNISILNFSKKLLGQIVFLYFLQKKGWLGLQEKEKYGEGDKNFLRSLFDKIKQGENFFNDYLEFLFYDALSKKRVTDYYERFETRIPFLNGGLFDPIAFYDWREIDIIISDKLFSNRKDDEEGSGILDVFDLYNFTVKEDEPLDTEVAIDPEMLGKVFERMLDVTERKSKGAFYTPREIVHYMAQQSLLYFLETELNQTTSYNKLGDDQTKIFGNESKKGQLDIMSENRTCAVPKADLEILIHYGEHIIDKDIAIEEGKLKQIAHKQQIPESIRQHADTIDKALENIKICDPAVGSGAFPVGIMNEIVKLRKLLTPFLRKGNTNERNAYSFKSNAIQNSIYGVDIDAGAIEVAKLRLWLSMVVDEERIDNIEPLPNLETKFVVANTLIGLAKPIEKTGNIFMSDANEQLEKLKKELKELRLLYFSASTRELKLQFQKEDKDLRKKIAKTLALDGWATNVSEQISSFNPYDQNTFAPWFDAEWMFGLQKDESNTGYFDIVIGNPPYVQLQKEGGKLANMLANQNFQTFARTGDIYAIFIEKGINILKTNGHLAFITSNKWMRAGYGESLRNFLAVKTAPIKLIDFGGFKVFESATVDTNILITKKIEKSSLYVNNKKECQSGITDLPFYACTINSDFKVHSSIFDYFDTHKQIMPRMTKDAWVISSSIEMQIKNKIEAKGTPLKDWDINIYRGVLTGFNEAFIIDGKKKNELIAADPKSAEIIKPILRGRDIKKYKAEFADLWLINSHNGIKEKRIPRIDVPKDYSAIYNHLKTFEKELIKRQDKGDHWTNLRNCAYLEEFEKEKIVYSELTQGSRFSFDNNIKYFVSNTAYILTGNSLKYLFAFLNSKFAEITFSKYYSTSLGAGSIRWLNQYMQEFPIPKISLKEQQPFIDLVDIILQKKEKNEDTGKEEKKIDNLVYKLYELTYDEVKVIDPEFGLSEQEYEDIKLE